MEVAVKSLGFFLLIYFSYYYILRFMQFVFQGVLGSINSNLSKAIYILGTPAHELAHLFISLVCLAKIEKVQLFPKENSPGFVKSRISSSIPFMISIKEFFIAIAPVIINIPLFIFIESKFVLKRNDFNFSNIIDLRIIFTKEGVITLILFIILISGIAPSHEDFKGMFKGLIIFGVTIFIISYLTSKFIDLDWINIEPIISIVVYYCEIIIFLMIINSIIHYRKFLRVNWNILINALLHTFKKN